jgi:hexosaminidase
MGAFARSADEFNGTLDIWPQPRSISSDTNVCSFLRIKTPFRFEYNKQGAPVPELLARAFDRYTNWTFMFGLPAQQRLQPYRYSIFAENELYTNCTTDAGAVQSLLVSVEQPVRPNEQFVVGVDESYRLTIRTAAFGPPQLSCVTVWGCLRGLETFAQLVQWITVGAAGARVTDFFIAGPLPFVIDDQPRFAWRGLLVDSARHFLSVPLLLDILDAMATNKLSVLHWHLSDAESFPFMSSTYPNLTWGGSYSTTTSRATYSPANVTLILQRANDRGIMVLPEFDMPGHTAAWFNSFPQVMADCRRYMRAVSKNDTGSDQIVWPAWNLMAMDPTKQQTYDTIRPLLQEIATAFPAPFLHVGGDEVQPLCWADVPSIGQWAIANNYTINQNGTVVPDYVRLQGYFERHVLNMSTELKKTPIVWEEAFLNDPSSISPSTIVNVWQDPSALQKVLAAGLQAVVSINYYLDRQSPVCLEDCHLHWMWEW